VRPRLVPLIALLALLTACGGHDEPSAATAAKPTVTPYPSIDLGDLENGASYASRKFKPELTLTIPQEGEWNTAGADNPDHVELEPEPVPPVSSSGISFHHMTRVFPPDKGGVTPGDAVAGPADSAAWLTSHPHPASSSSSSSGPSRRPRSPRRSRRSRRSCAPRGSRASRRPAAARRRCA
jgi:hypothetical protein